MAARCAVEIEFGMAEIEAGTAAGVGCAVFPLTRNATAAAKFDSESAPSVVVELV